MAESGPVDQSLLYLQRDHRSGTVWEERRVQHSSRLDCSGAGRFPGEWTNHVPGRVVQLIEAVGFYGAFRLKKKQLHHALITALVERWRQETHTFHLPIGKMTVTLQDVAVLFGLPVNGRPVTGSDDTLPTVRWQELCQILLGHTPPEDKIKGGCLKLKWLQSTFDRVPADADEDIMQCYARAYCLILIGIILMPDKSNNLVKLAYLPLLRDVSGSHQYSWDSTTLAVLYRELCKGCRKETKKISGPLFLLQCWAWERLPRLRHVSLSTTGDWMGDLQIGDMRFPSAPWGSRWKVSFNLDSEPMHVLIVYRDQLDRLQNYEVIWMPYPTDLLDQLPQYCRDGEEIWMASVPLICYEIVEYHYPRRTLRQFGFCQGIPWLSDTYKDMHFNSRREKFGTDWSIVHGAHIRAWDSRRPPDLSNLQVGTDVFDDYMPWYWGVTRRFIVNPSYRPNFGYHAVGGRPTIEEPDISNLMRMSELAIQTRQPGDFERVTYLSRDICSRAYCRQLPHQMPSPGHQMPSPGHQMPSPPLDTRDPPLDDDASAGPSTYGMDNFFSDYGTELGVSSGWSMGNTFVTLMMDVPSSSSVSVSRVTHGVPRGIGRRVSPVPWERNDEYLLHIVEEPTYPSTMDLGYITQVDHLQTEDTEELSLPLWRQRRNIRRRECGT